MIDRQMKPIGLASDDCGEGLSFQVVEKTLFKNFVLRNGRSDEIGPIGTVYDGDDKKNSEIIHIALYGCGRLCAVACVVLHPGRLKETIVCKLDSVVVDKGLRRRGLAKVIVLRLFLSALDNPETNVAGFLTHAVHPATVEIVNKLGFSKPPLMGAPLCAIQVDEDNKDELIKSYFAGYTSAITPLLTQCALCLAENAKANPWCKPKAEISNVH